MSLTHDQLRTANGGTDAESSQTPGYELLSVQLTQILPSPLVPRVRIGHHDVISVDKQRQHSHLAVLEPCDLRPMTATFPHSATGPVDQIELGECGLTDDGSEGRVQQRVHDHLSEWVGSLEFAKTLGTLHDRSDEEDTHAE